MNGQGRHYRDQADTANPVCDYESKGQKCDFFSSGHQNVLLEYPLDISVGPINTDSITSENSEVNATILQLLQQQKLDSDRRFNLLQQQISAINAGTNSAAIPITSIPTVSIPTTSQAFTTTASIMPSQTSTFSTPATAPHMVTSAATSLASQLQTGLGHHHNFGYQALTMDQLRSDQAVLAEANRLLANSNRNVPPLNPLAGMGEAMGTLRGGNSQVPSVDQLFAATTVNKQLRAFEFAATGQFSYKSQLKLDNCNAVTFAFGSFKHLEAVKLGLINMSDEEFLSRLRHLKNVFEVVCLSSNLTAFTDNAWQVAREYDTRVIADIESGAKHWETLSNGLETDAIYCAKETVENRNKAKKPSRDPPKDPKKPRDGKSSFSKVCSTFNTHRSSDGCFWEHSNKGETCVFDHFCSWCKANRDVKEKHKALNCEHKPE